MDKQLKEKAINFKGKEYVEVKERVKYFNDNYSGSITTKLLSKPEADMVIVKAFVRCEDEKGFRHIYTGMSQAKWSDTQSFVNKTSALENAETSAVGRALAFMGIGVIDSIASVDEIKKTTYTSPSPLKTPITNEVVREPIKEERMEFKDSQCPNCGADIIISPSTGKPFCKNKCWLPENSHFRLEFKNKK